MNFRYKVSTMFILVASILMIMLNSLNAAWLDTSALPVPPYAEEVKKESRRIAGQEFEFTYYTSTQDAKAIKDFYRLRLPNLGWQEKNLLKDLSQIPDFKVESSSSLSSALEQNLMFEKNGSTLIITFLPQGFSADKKTRFSLAQGKSVLTGEAKEGTDFIPELLAKPKKDVFPVYPGASLISLSEPPGSLRATYFTKDDINSVALFYKAQMPNYGWSLVEERAPEKINIPESGKDELAELCPSCAKNAAISPQDIETWIGQLSFSNPRGDTCDVVLSRVVPAEEVPGAFEMNTILVNYAEKKE